MLSRLISQNKYLVRISRDILKNNNDIKPTGSSSSPFPYKFGGIQRPPPNSRYIEVLGQDKKQDFILVYGNLLDAIANKNKNWLSQNTVQQLEKRCLSAQKIREINRQAEIQTLFFNMGIGIGVEFQRINIEYTTMASTNDVYIYSKKDLKPSLNFMTQGMPVLVGFQVGFRSSRKLITELEKKKGEEVHVLTFEQETRIEISKIASVMTSKMNQENMTKFRKMILGSTNPWKIGNIDTFLKGRYVTASLQ